MADTAIQDVAVTRDQAVEAARTNLNFLAAIGVPEVYQFPFPPIFLAIWQMITVAVQKSVGQEKLAIGLPRGFGKTIFLKLFVVYCILFTDRKFILIVCNTADLAENFVADVFDILVNNNILRIFGDWRVGEVKDTQRLKKFTFRGRHITIAGLGAGTSLRGLNLKFVRPDLILMDDMQSKEEAESAVDSGKMLSWMVGTLLKANNKFRCLFIFVGNMYPTEGSILRKLKHSNQWVSFITGAILEDGESLWPELRSVQSLLEELEHDESMGHPEIFYAEVMNDEEAGSRATIDFSKINYWQENPNQPLYHEAGFVLIDPSAAKNKKSDDVAIGAFLIFDGEPVLREVAVGQFNPGQQVSESIRLAAKHGLPAIVVEDVAYQSTLQYWMNQKLAQLGLTNAIRTLLISPEGAHKNSRIIAGLKQLTAQPKETDTNKGRIFLHRDVATAVKHQIIYFNPTKPNNKDDILDLLGYAYRIIAKFGPLLLVALSMYLEPVKMAGEDELELDF